MLTSNVQLGYVLTRGGGQAVQGGLSCPPPRISERKPLNLCCLLKLFTMTKVKVQQELLWMIIAGYKHEKLEQVPTGTQIPPASAIS